MGELIFKDNEIIIQKSEDVMSLFKGGSGSGNFGHSGRIGEVGGSGEEVINNDKLIKFINETDKLEDKNYLLKYLDNKVEYIKNKINPNMSKENITNLRTRIYEYINERDKGKDLLGNVKIDKAYQNEHAARLQNPDNFDSFARKNDRFGNGINVIFGIRDNKATIQSIRFDKEKYSIDEAKKWLKDHNYSPISFEPAKDSIQKSEDVMSLFKGGSGSGNFGHSGRIGEVGGSSSDGETGQQITNEKMNVVNNETLYKDLRQYISDNHGLSMDKFMETELYKRYEDTMNKFKQFDNQKVKIKYVVGGDFTESSTHEAIGKIKVVEDKIKFYEGRVTTKYKSIDAGIYEGWSATIIPLKIEKV